MAATAKAIATLWLMNDKFLIYINALLSSGYIYPTCLRRTTENLCSLGTSNVDYNRASEHRTCAFDSRLSRAHALCVYVSPPAHLRGFVVRLLDQFPLTMTRRRRGNGRWAVAPSEPRFRNCRGKKRTAVTMRDSNPGRSGGYSSDVAVTARRQLRHDRRL